MGSRPERMTDNRCQLQYLLLGGLERRSISAARTTWTESGRAKRGGTFPRRQPSPWRFQGSLVDQRPEELFDEEGISSARAIIFRNSSGSGVSMRASAIRVALSGVSGSSRMSDEDPRPALHLRRRSKSSGRVVPISRSGPGYLPRRSSSRSSRGSSAHGGLRPGSPRAEPPSGRRRSGSSRRSAGLAPPAGGDRPRGRGRERGKDSSGSPLPDRLRRVGLERCRGAP